MRKTITIIPVLVLLFSACPAAAQQLSLEQAISMAEANNPGIDQLAAAIEQADRLLSQSRAALYPVLDYKFSITGYLDEDPYAAAFQDTGDFTNQLALSYSVYSPTRRPAISAGRYSADAGRKDLERYMDSLRTLVYNAFMQAYLAEQSLDVNMKSRDYFEELKKNAGIRVKEGMTPETDFLTFSNSFDSALIQLESSRYSRRMAILALEKLIHEPVGDRVSLIMPEIASGGDDYDPEALIMDALGRREDVRASELRLKAAESAIEISKGGKKPSVSVGAAYQHEENAITQLDHNDDVTTVYAQINWRLSDGHYTGNAVSEAQAKKDALEAGLADLKWTVRADVLDSYYRIVTAKEKIRVLENTVRNAEKNLDILTKRYREGLITVINITDAELNLTTFRLSLIQARVDLGTGRRALELALGGGTN
ncbi:MAG TPA: TolC family protein [bacterium]|nr:TolC family protein [bacterium]